jgi:two-component system chemotaxis response regulator CheB
MDIIMPVMDGMEATRIIMSEMPTPVVVVTSTLTKVDIIPTFNALTAGALTMVRKPGLSDPKACEEVIRTVRLMADVPTVRLHAKRTPTKPRAVAEKKIERAKRQNFVLDDRNSADIKVAGIVSSTGGPGVLSAILKSLPADFRVPILIVQHVTNGFAAGLTDWLDSETEITVRLAAHGERIRPGEALIAPDDYHLLVTRRGFIELFKGEPYKSLRPSGNYLLSSLAQSFGRQAMGVICTGMGDDGAEGMAELHEAGGLTIAQEEQSCVVFGMPKEAIQLKAVDHILTPSQIASAIKSLQPAPIGVNHDR